MAFSSEPIHSGLILNPEEAEMDKLCARNTERCHMAIVSELPRATPTGSDERLMRLGLVRLEGVSSAKPLSRERKPLRVMLLGMGDHGPEGPPRLAVSPGPEDREFTRRSLHCR